MIITEVNVKQSNSLDKTFEGIASINIDNELIINDIKIFNNEGDYSIEFPNTSRAIALNKHNIVPTSYAVRKYISTLIIQEWLVYKRKNLGG